MLVMLQHMENLVISELDDLNKHGKKSFFVSKLVISKGKNVVRKKF